MAPINLTDCFQERLNESQQTTASYANTTSIENVEKSELQALLYIVVTLLFYSLGIIVGIVSYLKREKRELEEDKIYDQYVATRQDPEWSSKYEKVQQVISRLQVLEKEKLARINAEKETEKLLQNEQNRCDSPDFSKTKSKLSIHFKPNIKLKFHSSNESVSKKDKSPDRSSARLLESDFYVGDAADKSYNDSVS